jgi:outer membrane protein assembly factor BamB
LFALDGANGATRWTKDIPVGIGSPPLIIDSRVIFGGGRRRVFSYLTDGSRDWVFDTLHPVAGELATGDGNVYVGTSEGEVIALNPSSGQAKWHAPIGFAVSAPVAGPGVVYAGASDGSVRALDAATGAPRWVFKTGGPISGAPTLANGTLYIGSEDLYVYALDAATGKLKWRFYAGGAVRSAPAVVGPTVIIPTVTGQLIGVVA